MDSPSDPFWHVTSTRNRQSILEHGLDWRRMAFAPGIAGSTVPEQEGCFLSSTEFESDFFVRMNNTGGPVDVWEARGVDAAALVAGHEPEQHADRGGDRPGEEGHQQRNRQRDQHQAQHVAPESVGAQRVLVGGIDEDRELPYGHRVLGADAPVQERLVEQGCQGSHDQPLSRFTLPFSRQQVADVLGLTIETVSRQFTRLKSEGLIDLPSRREVEIRDREGLLAEAG